MEMRIDYGPGYRVYYIQRGGAVVILLCSGDKSRQQTDIKRALAIVDNMETTRFDAAEYLETPELQAAYITVALETGDSTEVRDAIGIVARARGMADIAAAANLNPKSLYKALGESGNPEFATVLSVLNALGLTLSAAPTVPHPAKRKRKPASSQKSAA